MLAPSPPIARLLGYRATHVAAGTTTIVMPASDACICPNGQLEIVPTAVTALEGATLTALPGGMDAVPMRFTFKAFRPAWPGTGNILARARILNDGHLFVFSEVQLEALVRNVLPTQAFEMQYTLSNGTRVDCVLKLPAPTGLVCVDSKFPLENYKLMLDPKANEADRAIAQKAFRADVRKHIDAIASKYIVDNETSDGAVMFVPAEAVFAEIHAYHSEVVDYAIGKRVWIVSPTTLMAVLNTARAVLKDVETRKQIHVIKEALARLAVEFARFDDRLKKLADHIRQAHEDAERIQITGGKISQQFQRIESAELEAPEAARLKVVE